MPKLSTLFLSWNARENLRHALRSYLETTQGLDHEVIVVDDGSTDNTPDVLRNEQSIWQGLMNFKVITLPVNSGVGAACNVGIKASKGYYIVRVDSDDYINEKMLEIEELFLTENKEFDAVACDYWRVDDNGERLVRFDCSLFPIDCGVMYRKDRMGLYENDRADSPSREKFYENHTVFRIPLPLYRYRKREGSLSCLLQK